MNKRSKVRREPGISESDGLKLLLVVAFLIGAIVVLLCIASQVLGGLGFGIPEAVTVYGSHKHPDPNYKTFLVGRATEPVLFWANLAIQNFFWIFLLAIPLLIVLYALYPFIVATLNYLVGSREEQAEDDKR